MSLSEQEETVLAVRERARSVKVLFRKKKRAWRKVSACLGVIMITAGVGTIALGVVTIALSALSLGAAAPVFGGVTVAGGLLALAAMPFKKVVDKRVKKLRRMEDTIGGIHSTITTNTSLQDCKDILKRVEQLHLEFLVTRREMMNDLKNVAKATWLENKIKMPSVPTAPSQPTPNQELS